MPPANPEDLTDSTDWLTTHLSPLFQVESSLRCQVCKDFYVTPMMTSCSHTFCSLCIRRYLSQEGKCPTCRESDQEVKLRRNWVVEELVERFVSGRAGMLEFARSAGRKRDEEEEGPSAKRRKVVERQRVEEEPERRSTRSTRSQSKRQASQTVEEEVHERMEVVDSEDGGSEYEDQTDNKAPSDVHDGLVSCPICGRKVKEASINAHLDSCIGGGGGDNNTNTSSPRRSNTPQLPIHPNIQAQTRTLPRRERLPTINYSMLNDNALRKKLKDLGISSMGSKETMRRRHTEWVNLWNANCDARNPVSKQDLLRELNQWERTLGRQIDRGVSGVMVKDFDRENWQQSNKNDFDDLIAQARAKRAAAVAAATSAVPSTSSPEPATEKDSSILQIDVSTSNGDSNDHAEVASNEPNGRGDLPNHGPSEHQADLAGTRGAEKGEEEEVSKFWGRTSADHDAISGLDPHSQDGRSSNFDLTRSDIGELTNGTHNHKTGS